MVGMGNVLKQMSTKGENETWYKRGATIASRVYEEYEN